ncbi:unnamed protein product [Candidula unifasciata]|uniref:Glutaredoxin domain-containing protein n=1 Tax=Candidula unifasciata TaxID=100452 RepID=A0A8S3YJL8_9EUPU|nr:unnamed protein product [Candidula unifasciata]
MANVRDLVNQKIDSNKLMVFSKSTCPYCIKAKQTLSKYVGDDNAVSPDDYEVLEIDGLPNCSEIQDYLLQITGARSVPRVFINQKFVGGCDDVVALDKSGKLKALLQ